jgi:hypothetical protein
MESTSPKMTVVSSSAACAGLRWATEGFEVNFLSALLLLIALS